MKAIGVLLMVALLFICNGCMTYSSVRIAQGRQGEWVQMKPSDQIIRSDGTNCVLQRISPAGETNEVRLHLITPKAGYVRKPGYYALLPVTIPADIVTFPFQLIFFMIAPVG